MQLIYSIELSKPMVGLKLDNSFGNYDFADVATLLGNLEAELTARGHQAAVEQLVKVGVNLEDASRQLAAVIPNVMSSPFNQMWAERLRNAALEELLHRLENPEGMVPAASKSLAFARVRSNLIRMHSTVVS